MGGVHSVALSFEVVGIVSRYHHDRSIALALLGNDLQTFLAFGEKYRYRSTFCHLAMARHWFLGLPMFRDMAVLNCKALIMVQPASNKAPCQRV